MARVETALERDRLAGTVAALLAPGTEDEARPLEAAIRAVLDDTPLDEIERLRERLARTGNDWGYHPPDPLARRLGRAILRVLLAEGAPLAGAANLEWARREPVVFVGNHLSFVDANAFEHVVAEAGYPDVSERLTTLVGPKVYSQSLRRFASLCFGTVKLPQSPSRASDEAVMPPREVARLASDAIRTVRERITAGDHILIFVEGSRSRVGSMQRGLAAVARYLEPPTQRVVPFAVWGSETLVPMEGDRTRRATVQVRVGPPVPAALLLERCRTRRPLVIDTVGFLIADLLPEEHRGVYGSLDGPLARAREIAHEIARPGSGGAPAH